MRARRGSAQARAAAAIFLLGCARCASAQGFFDALPAKGYVKGDVSLDVLNAGDQKRPVARIRYVKLVLDPGTRDVAWDYWPEREMLLVEHASGERLIFERIAKLPPSADPAALLPRARALVADTIPILYAAQTQGLPTGTLELLDVFFPGRAFAHEARGLTFRPSGTAPLNPSDGAWRIVTDPPEMLPGSPLS